MGELLLEYNLGHGHVTHVPENLENVKYSNVVSEGSVFPGKRKPVSYQINLVSGNIVENVDKKMLDFWSISFYDYSVWSSALVTAIISPRQESASFFFLECKSPSDPLIKKLGG